MPRPPKTVNKFKIDAAILKFGSDACRLEAAFASGAGQSPDAGYLRAAQAYMLISMPTGTSTIFGVFQAIHVSRVFYGAMFAPGRS